VEAYQKLYEFFQSGRKTAVVQIPVGCGKSGIAAIAPFGIARGRVLVVAPNLTIKEGLFESLDITNRQKMLLAKTGYPYRRSDDRRSIGNNFGHRQSF
jgi:DNA repair protein RadD